MKEKLQVLDKMNEMLSKLKMQFNQDEKVSREVFQDIMQSDFENMLVSMKEEYTQMFQSNRQIVKSDN